LCGGKTRPNTTDRGEPGSKHHLVVDKGGIPLAVTYTAANVYDSMVSEELVDAEDHVLQPRCRPRKQPKKLHANKANDAKKGKNAPRKRGIRSRIARKGNEISERLGRRRWVEGMLLSWLNRHRGLKVRYERRAGVHQAFLGLRYALIRWGYVQRFC
jgi:hypothetical protein